MSVYNVPGTVFASPVFYLTTGNMLSLKKPKTQKTKQNPKPHKVFKINKNQDNWVLFYKPMFCGET